MMSDDFRDDDEREDEITEMDENDDREIVVEGMTKATDVTKGAVGGGEGGMWGGGVGRGGSG